MTGVHHGALYAKPEHLVLASAVSPLSGTSEVGAARGTKDRHLLRSNPPGYVAGKRCNQLLRLLVHGPPRLLSRLSPCSRNQPNDDYGQPAGGSLSLPTPVGYRICADTASATLTACPAWPAACLASSRQRGGVWRLAGFARSLRHLLDAVRPPGRAGRGVAPPNRKPGHHHPWQQASGSDAAPIISVLSPPPDQAGCLRQPVKAASLRQTGFPTSAACLRQQEFSPIKRPGPSTQPPRARAASGRAVLDHARQKSQ